MVNHSVDDDSDEELGAYIYSIIRAAQLLREEVAARNNEIPTDNNNDNNITRPTTRKSPHALKLQNVSLSSHLSSSTISKCNMREKRKTPEIDHVPSSAKSSTDHHRCSATCSNSKSTSTNNHDDCDDNNIPKRKNAVAARNNGMTTNNDNNIARPQRKSPREVGSTSASSEPKERMKKKMKKFNYISMTDYSDDSDEELGAYIYSISRTAQLLREEAAARNNGMTTNNDNDITRSKRKSPHEVESTSVSSEPKERMKKKMKKYNYICSNEGCTNNVQRGGGCIRHGAKDKTCTTEDLPIKQGMEEYV